MESNGSDIKLALCLAKTMKQKANRVVQPIINFYSQSLYILCINNIPVAKDLVALFSGNLIAARKDLLILIATHYKKNRSYSEMTPNPFSFRMHLKIVSIICLFSRSVACEKLPKLLEPINKKS